MAGMMKSLLQESGDDGRRLALARFTGVLVAGSLISEVGPAWEVAGFARVGSSVGAQGNITVEIDPGGTLTITSDAGTDESAVMVLLAKGGSVDTPTVS